MGLDVWVVKMEHVDSPTGLLKEFLFDLTENLDWGYDGWGGGWEGNAFIEVFKEDLGGRAWDYASKQSLSQTDVNRLLFWVKDLPWERDDIMLHLGW